MCFIFRVYKIVGIKSQMTSNLQKWDTSNEPTVTCAARFRIGRMLEDTMQGHIYVATDLETNETVVVKQTFIFLVQHGITRDMHPVLEDFLKERRILIHLSKKCSNGGSKEGYNNDEEPGFVRLIFSWQDSHSYYYAMQYCEGI